MPSTDNSLSPIAPLRLPVFRMMWSTWLVANLCMWMNDVAAAWMMTSLTTTPIWVALVQTASTLPVFLLGLPSGALADNLDRKRYYLVTQLWVAVVATILSGFVFFGVMSPPLLLALVFLNGIGMAMPRLMGRLGIAAVSGWLAMAAANRWMPDSGQEDDLTPKRVITAPVIDSPPKQGHIMLTIEYLIEPARAREFRELMFNESRRSRLRQGALSWELLHDINEPGRFVEVIVDESWTDHLRRFDRATASDVALRDRRLAFHIGLEPPKVTRSLMETTVRGG